MSPHLQTLLSDVARALALPLPFPLAMPLELAFDAVTVTVDYEPRWPDSVVIHGTLGRVAPAHEMAVYRALLDANLFWAGTGDATIGVDADTRCAVAAYRCDLRAMSAESLLALVEQFVVLVELWRRFIAAPAAQAPQFPSCR